MLSSASPMLRREAIARRRKLRRAIWFERGTGRLPVLTVRFVAVKIKMVWLWLPQLPQLKKR